MQTVSHFTGVDVSITVMNIHSYMYVKKKEPRKGWAVKRQPMLVWFGNTTHIEKAMAQQLYGIDKWIDEYIV